MTTQTKNFKHKSSLNHVLIRKNMRNIIEQSQKISESGIVLASYNERYPSKEDFPDIRNPDIREHVIKKLKHEFQELLNIEKLDIVYEAEGCDNSAHNTWGIFQIKLIKIPNSKTSEKNADFDTAAPTSTTKKESKQKKQKVPFTFGRFILILIFGFAIAKLIIPYFFQ